MNAEYKLLIQGFEKWLKTLEYAESTVYASTNYLRDFFIYLQKSGITALEEINKTVIEIYHEHLQTRRNKKQAGSLSQNYIISNINALRRFVKYLQITGKPVFEISLKIPIEKEKFTQTILTRSEVKALYNACSNDALGLRDRAMLAVYYGCGLRRNEGASLDVSDVLLKEKLVYVQKGKGYRERYVPMSEGVKEDLENYIHVGRNSLLSCGPQMKEQALFLSVRGKRMNGNSLFLRLKELVKMAGLNKSIGLHTLRHSIATHLLQSGMGLESVSRFLGHQSLESTQIYTHLANE
jgi:integrase/recombinase XerD